MGCLQWTIHQAQPVEHYFLLGIEILLPLIVRSDDSPLMPLTRTAIFLTHFPERWHCKRVVQNHNLDEHVQVVDAHRSSSSVYAVPLTVTIFAD